MFLMAMHACKQGWLVGKKSIAEYCKVAQYENILERKLIEAFFNTTKKRLNFECTLTSFFTKIFIPDGVCHLLQGKRLSIKRDIRNSKTQVFAIEEDQNFVECYAIKLRCL